MNEMISKLVSGIRKDGVGVRAAVDGNALIIDCTGCGLMPEPGSTECLRCMVNMMGSEGGAERIILRTGKDLEISGSSAKAVRGIASLKRWSVPLRERERRCVRCESSRTHVMNVVWDSFPESGFDAARDRLSKGPESDSCSLCLRMTGRALDQLESDLDRVRLELLG